MKRLRKTLIITGVVILSLPIIMVLLVRFTNGSFSAGKFYLGYDESKGKFEFEKHKLNGIDGPYLFDNKIVTVTDDNKIVVSPFSEDTIVVRVNNSEKDTFRVPLKTDIELLKGIYEAPEKLIAISDIEGNFDGFASFLSANKVIDDNFNWIFGDGHLLLLGDFVDRGDNVIPVLWLIYKLENEAVSANGKVHFILGNHEIMNIQGNLRYAQGKYQKLATELGQKETDTENRKVLFSADSELGKWLRSKNAMEIIGNRAFVHAGLNPEILDFNISVDSINKIVRANIDKKSNPENSDIANFLMGHKGPFWYRGLVSDYKQYSKTTITDLEKVLDFYNVEKIVVGHTIVDDVSCDYNEKVIRIDVKHGNQKYSGLTKGLLIENDIEYKIDDKGNREKL